MQLKNTSQIIESVYVDLKKYADFLFKTLLVSYVKNAIKTANEIFKNAFTKMG